MASFYNVGNFLRGKMYFWIVFFLWGTLLGCGLEEEGEPSKALLEVLSHYDVCHDGSWKSIQEETEKAWLSHGRLVERWEIQAIEDDSPERTFALFTQLGMTQTVVASDRCYDYGIVLGATIQQVRRRFWFLKKEWEKGVRFHTLVVLTGNRPLDPILESEKILIDPAFCPYPFRDGWYFCGSLPKNETEMMQLVFDQLELPEEWRKMPITFVDTPAPPGFKRPHTEHTLQHWLSSNPTRGTLLAISNQPFVCRQNALLKLYRPIDFTIETTGGSFSFEEFVQEKRATAILLAELAYWIKLYYAASMI